jgi:hypothetical protein
MCEVYPGRCSDPPTATKLGKNAENNKIIIKIGIVTFSARLNFTLLIAFGIANRPRLIKRDKTGRRTMDTYIESIRKGVKHNRRTSKNISGNFLFDLNTSDTSPIGIRIVKIPILFA